ncbi:MAG: hypothetical protein ABW223_12545, partial [Rariglobus sp.]
IYGSSQDSFYRQIARLDYILEETRRQNALGQLKSVNLAVGDKQVPVSFDLPPDARANSRASTSSAARPAPSVSGTALFSPPLRNSSPSTRDF